MKSQGRLRHGQQLAARLMGNMADLRALWLVSPEDAERIRRAVEAEIIAMTEPASLSERVEGER